MKLLEAEDQPLTPAIQVFRLRYFIGTRDHTTNGYWIMNWKVVSYWYVVSYDNLNSSQRPFN